MDCQHCCKRSVDERFTKDGAGVPSAGQHFGAVQSQTGSRAGFEAGNGGNEQIATGDGAVFLRGFGTG